MVERKITSDTEARDQWRKVGVVVFIFNLKGELLLLQEKGKTHDTDGAISGDFSVICETGNPGEDWAENVVRGIREELGESILEDQCLTVHTKKCFLGESIFGPGVLARVAMLYYRGEADEIFTTKGDGEITVVGWEKPEAILNHPLRAGVRKILEECIQEGLFTELVLKTEDLQPLSLDTLRTTAAGVTKFT